MKLASLLVALLLSGCALAGLEGPERQARAQEAARELPGVLLEGVGQFSQGYAGTGGSTEDKLDRLERHARNEAIWEGEWPYYP